MDVSIKNIDDLRIEISRLKGVEQEQALAIRQRFSGLTSTISTVLSLFSKSGSTEGGAGGGIFGTDIIQLISGFLLPFTLNKTIFKRSNFIVKAVVRLASQKAARFINAKSLSFIWDKVKSIIPEKTPKTTSAYSGLSNPE